MSETIDPAVFDFFAGLPQQGPGTRKDSIGVLDRVMDGLPPRPNVADMGCGTGRTTLTLARHLPDARIVAIDLAAPFIRTLRNEVQRQNLDDRVRVALADMGSPPIRPGSLDLLWCEGAAYIIGFANALSIWRPLLKPSAYCVVSECEWLKDERPDEAVKFWRENYPDMATRKENIAHAEAAGYAVLGTHVLSAEGWDEYYGPIAQAIADGRAACLGEDFARRLAEERVVYANGDQSFGYVFYVMRRVR